MRHLISNITVLLILTLLMLSASLTIDVSLAQSLPLTPRTPQTSLSTNSFATPATWSELGELDETCADCHPDVVERWLNSPMGSSFKRLKIDKQEATTKLIFETTHPHSGNTYQVKGEGSALSFRQSKETVHDERRAQIAIGGTHAVTYLWADGDALFEAPLTHYGERWGLSPGYDQKDYGLYRPITPGCLQCHAEPVSPKARTLNRYERLPKRGIGCARCHGDSRAHVKARLEGRDTLALTAAQMGRERAQERCDQCHFGGTVRVTRTGQQWIDYRPGEPLADTIAIFTREKRANGLSSVSHRDRLNLSACQEGGAPLDCTSCHPPHEQRLKDPNAPCVSCHATKPHPSVRDSSKATELIIPKATGCVDCHMRREGLRNVPHLSTLDHWIRRQPSAEPQAKDSEAALIWANRPSGDLNPSQNVRDQLLFGRAYYKAWRQGGQRSDLRRAYEHLTAGLTVDQSDPEAWFTLAELTAEVSLSGLLPTLSGEVGARIALDAAERAWRLGLKQSELPLLLSELYLRWGRVADAQRVIAQALSHDPKRGALLKRSAELARQSGLVAEALSTLESALALNPFDIRSLFEKALTLQGARRWGEARYTLTTLLSLEPDWIEARLNLAWLEYQDQRPQEAFKAFQEAERRGASRPLPPQLLAQSLSGQALALESLGQLIEAIPIAQRALDTGAPAPGAFSLLGRGALAQGRPHDAVVAFTKALSQQANDGPAWWGLAKAQRSLGELPSAKQAAERAASLGVTEARAWLSQAH